MLCKSRVGSLKTETLAKLHQKPEYPTFVEATVYFAAFGGSGDFQK